MLNSHKLLLVGVGLSILALAVAGTISFVGATSLGPVSTTEEWVWGEEVGLQVSIDAGLVGGQGNLFYRVAGEAPVPAGTFDFTDTSFPISLQLPSNSAYADRRITVWYDATAPWGEPLGGSDRVRRKPKPPIEWE